jgi:drug/metabolite transporter (DMT)-like permease
LLNQLLRVDHALGRPVSRFESLLIKVFRTPVASPSRLQQVIFLASGKPLGYKLLWHTQRASAEVTQPSMNRTTPTPTDVPAAPAWMSVAPVIFVLLWSTGFIGSRLTAPYAEPLSFLAIRFAIVAGILCVAGFAMKASWPDRRMSVHCMITGALMHGGYLGFVFWSIWKGMPAGVSALIVGLQPLVTALLAGLFLGERITPRHWAGLFIGLVGIAMVIWPKFTLTDVGITPVTVTANILAMLSITFGSLYQKRFMARVDLRTGNAWQFVGATIVTGLAALAIESFDITWNGPVIFGMTWLVLVLSIGAISLLYLMIRHGEISRVTTLFYLVPGVTALIAWVMFGEALVPLQIAGMAVCAGAVMLATRRT